MILGGLKIYTVHIKPEAEDPAATAVFVRDGGFSIWAFLFVAFWTLYQRLWWPTVLLVAFNVAMISIGKAHIFSPLTMGFIQLGLQIWVGFKANDWIRERLARQGYIVSDIVTGDSLLRAEQRYFDRYLAAA